MIRIRDIKIPATSDQGMLLDEVAAILCLDSVFKDSGYPDFSVEVCKRSVDARKKPDIFFVYTVRLLIGQKDEERIRTYLRKHPKDPKVKRATERIIKEPETVYFLPECGNEILAKRPVVIGMGPAGMFAALLLARRGFCPLVVEMGESVEERTKSVERFWTDGVLDPYSNVQFGEGGAGTFSDGKLNTLTKDKGGRNSFVIWTFYDHGAPVDITVEAKPHIGTDVLKKVVRSIREEIISLGGQILFNTKLSDISTEDGVLRSLDLEDTITHEHSTVETDICILCIGHSARETFEMLYDRGVNMLQKSFATGFRVIHPQGRVNEWQYGLKDIKGTILPPADYKVTNETSKGRRVYSFCMCPGGYVVNASSEYRRLCINGMSENKRDGGYANSAIIAAIDPDDFRQDVVAADHPLAGMYYQRLIEEEAFRRGEGAIPVQSFASFENDSADAVTDENKLCDAVKGRTKIASLRGIFSDDIDEAVIESMHKFGYTMKGFDDEAMLCGIEARTSSPVRMDRDDGFVSNIKGLYPCGEGAGYAGGITSAAADGMRVAEAVIERYRYERTR